MKETVSPWLQPMKICGRDAGRITENSIVNGFTFSTRAESMIFCSTFSTPLIVLASTGQKVARKMTITETERKVGRSAIP